LTKAAGTTYITYGEYKKTYLERLMRVPGSFLWQFQHRPTGAPACLNRRAAGFRDIPKAYTCFTIAFSLRNQASDTTP